MELKLSLLHTAQSHQSRFEHIVGTIGSDITVAHFVNEKLLETALDTGKVDVPGFEHEIRKIKRTKFGKIICTCSTYGALCDNKEVFRIDQPIAEKIVANYTKIGIAYTLNSTLESSQALLRKLAEKQGKYLDIKTINCQGCWRWFEIGDFQKYAQAIADQIQREVKDCELIFLAQASMEGAKTYLSRQSYTTVSSPVFGIQKYIALIRAKAMEKPK